MPKRCPWVTNGDDLYIAYHDTEWGVPVHDDRRLYEFLVLETFQAGLSWRTVLHKRKNFEKAFNNFDYTKVAKYTARDIARLIADDGIIRNRQKIVAAIENAKRFMDVRKEFGTFSKYMWAWVKGKPIRHTIKTAKDYPVHIPEAVAWSNDLKKRGFKFLGPTTVYAHIHAMGMVNDHVVGCWRRGKRGR